MLQTRAVFLSKDANSIDDPLAYRILKITSGWYRKWASCRNRELTDWVRTWDCPELNSGVPRKGAQDAWLNTALQLELAQLSDQLVAGGSIDVYKCFDKINRDLVYKIASDAGMPLRILDAYFRYIDALQNRYQVGDSVGSAHLDRCSIPQGCPFSMTMIALIMLPWIKLMRSLDVEARVLADDLMFTAVGKGHRARIVQAMHASRQFFSDIGAQVANKKCVTFAGDSATRTLLLNHSWDNQGLRIPCTASFRDLGTHLNLLSNHNGATLTHRMTKAANFARRLKWIPISPEMKERIVLANVIPAALYGVEAANVSSKAMAGLRSAIAGTIGPSSHKKNVNLVFDCVSSSKDLDPLCHVLYMRIAGLRRMMAKHKGLQARIRLIIRRYKTTPLARKRTPYSIWECHDEDAIPCLVDGGPDSDTETAFGPVGLLIQDLQECGYDISDGLIISRKNEPDIDLWHMPWQHLEVAILGIMARHRSQVTVQQRTFCGPIAELDQPILKTVINGLGNKEKRVFRHIATGAFSAQDQLADIQLGLEACPHCGTVDKGTEHILWKCAAIHGHCKHKDLIIKRCRAH